MRTSSDEIRDGIVVNGYDYELQVWVKGGVVLRCGHPESMKGCCNAREYAGQRIADIKGHEVRS